MADPQDGTTQGEAQNASASNPDNDSAEADRLSTNDIEKLLDQATESLEQARGEKTSAEPAALRLLPPLLQPPFAWAEVPESKAIAPT